MEEKEEKEDNFIISDIFAILNRFGSGFFYFKKLKYNEA